MILSDKIIRLRKKNGWSQEELAARMNVSRQAVSKWEGAQAVPDPEKILQLSSLFGVTTDYLLKDDMEEEEYTPGADDGDVRHVSLEDARLYLAQRKTAAKKIAAATFLLIASPIVLLLLIAMAQVPGFPLSDDAAVAIGICVILVFVACAVPIYIDCGFRNKAFAFLDDSVPFETDHAVRSMVKECQKNYQSTYIRYHIVAVCLCIVGVIPLIISAFTDHLLFIMGMVCLLLAVVATAVFLFITAGIQNAAMKKLLQEGEYTLENKQSEKFAESLGGIYWAIITAVYLVWSFTANAWAISWIVFAVGGILFSAVIAVYNLIQNQKNKK